MCSETLPFPLKRPKPENVPPDQCRTQQPLSRLLRRRRRARARPLSLRPAVPSPRRRRPSRLRWQWTGWLKPVDSSPTSGSAPTAYWKHSSWWLGPTAPSPSNCSSTRTLPCDNTSKTSAPWVCKRPIFLGLLFKSEFVEIFFFFFWVDFLSHCEGRFVGSMRF